MSEIDATTGATLAQEGLAKGSGLVTTYKVLGDFDGTKLAAALFDLKSVQAVKAQPDKQQFQVQTQGQPDEVELTSALTPLGLTLGEQVNQH